MRRTQEAQLIPSIASSNCTGLGSKPNCFKVWIICSAGTGGLAVTVTSWVTRLALTAVTPGSVDNLRSMRPTQEAQLMPLTKRVKGTDAFMGNSLTDHGVQDKASHEVKVKY